MNLLKRLAVIKRRLCHRLILKTQAPEYYGRLQSRIRMHEREIEYLRVSLACARNNEQFYRAKYDGMRARLRSLKETKSARAIAG